MPDIPSKVNQSVKSKKKETQKILTIDRGIMHEKAKFLVKKLLSTVVLYQDFSKMIHRKVAVVSWMRDKLHSRNEVFWGKVAMIQHQW